MKTPREKFMNDPEYRHLVETMESLIHRAHFTPSEMREACILACINYEMRQVRSVKIDPELTYALEILDRKFASKRSGGNQ